MMTDYQRRSTWRHRVHTIEESQRLPTDIPPRCVGRKWVYYDCVLDKTRVKIQLDYEAGDADTIHTMGRFRSISPCA